MTFQTPSKTKLRFFQPAEAERSLSGGSLRSELRSFACVVAVSSRLFYVNLTTNFDVSSSEHEVSSSKRQVSSSQLQYQL